MRCTVCLAMYCTVFHAMYCVPCNVLCATQCRVCRALECLPSAMDERPLVLTLSDGTAVTVEPQLAATVRQRLFSGLRDASEPVLIGIPHTALKTGRRAHRHLPVHASSGHCMRTVGGGEGDGHQWQHSKFKFKPFPVCAICSRERYSVSNE